MGAKASLFNWYQGMTPLERGIVVIAVLGIGTYTAIEVIQAINNKAKQLQAQAQLVQDVTDLNTLKNNGVVPSADTTQYNTWAQSIVQALTGKDLSFAVCWPLLEYSNSGDTVAAIIGQLKNDADFLALSAAFGIQTIQKGWLESNYTNVTLAGALADQFQSCEIDGFNAILASNNISHTF